MIRRLRRFDRLTSLPVKFETVDLGGEELALVECQVPANVNAHETASASVEATAHNATGASADTAFTTGLTTVSADEGPRSSRKVKSVKVYMSDLGKKALEEERTRTRKLKAKEENYFQT